jgi:hypothetical protein
LFRNLILRLRLAGAEDSSLQFMTQCNHLGGPIDPPAQASEAADRTSPSGACLRELLKARRVRANFFGAHLFADPAWDILLHSYVALLDEEPLLVSALLRTSFVPATTMLRWVKALEQERWLELMEGPLECPRCSLRLSAQGRIAMERYLATVWPSLPL